LTRASIFFLHKNLAKIDGCGSSPRMTAGTATAIAGDGGAGGGDFAEMIQTKVPRTSAQKSSNLFALRYRKVRTISVTRRQAFETRAMPSCRVCEFRSAPLSGNGP
jgi:hypothetical protein